MFDERAQVLGVITAIRESHRDMVYLYTEGQCYNFYKILRSIFGVGVECWYDSVVGHVYSKIGDVWYDINGCYDKRPGDAEPMELAMSSDHPENWGTRDTRRLIDLARLTETDARDLSSKPLVGIPRGQLHVVSSLDAPIWSKKSTIALKDVLAHAEGRGYHCRPEAVPRGTTAPFTVEKKYERVPFRSSETGSRSRSYPHNTTLPTDNGRRPIDVDLASVGDSDLLEFYLRWNDSMIESFSGSKSTRIQQPYSPVFQQYVDSPGRYRFNVSGRHQTFWDLEEYVRKRGLIPKEPPTIIDDN